MRSILAIALLFPFTLPGSATAAEASDILGVWETSGDDRAHVEFTREGDTYTARIIELLQPRFPDDDETHPGQIKVDRENPDPALRDRPVEGMRIAYGFAFDPGAEAWKDGRIYDPESGNTYKCVIRLQRDGDLKVRGYVGFSLFGRTEIWTPVTTEPSEGAEGG